ncbi:MAG: GntR family transcriptional regulator [Lautropia sp.]
MADVLKRGIERGVWPVGSRLPTEVELCETHAISRFTAREAIRVLAAAGLVTRRQRIGTIVTALPEDARFNHEIRSLADLLQYARTTRMRFSSVVRAPVGRKEARRLGLREGEAWVRATGVRVDPGTDSPICVTRLYLNPMFVGIERRLRGCRTAVYALIEKQYGLSTERVEQELVGVALDEEDARMLGVPRGSPALQIIRHYYGANDRLLEVSDSVHPSDRFTYRVSVRK